MKPYYEIKLVEGNSQHETMEVVKNNRKIQQEGFIGTAVGPHGRHWWRVVAKGKTITYLNPKSWTEECGYGDWEAVLKYEIVRPKEVRLLISCNVGDAFSWHSAKLIKRNGYKVNTHYDVYTGAQFSAIQFVEI